MSIRGFQFLPNFLPKEKADSLLIYGSELSKQITKSASKSKTLLYQSNPKSQNLRLLSKKISIGGCEGQHFTNNDNSYQSTQFLEQRNIPKPVLIPLAHKLQHYGCDPLGYHSFMNLTFDRCAPKMHHDPSFEKDLPQNGDKIAIYSVGAECFFEFETQQIRLYFSVPHNTLILLSSDARWDHKYKMITYWELQERFTFKIGYF